MITYQSPPNKTKLLIRDDTEYIKAYIYLGEANCVFGNFFWKHSFFSVISTMGHLRVVTN